MQVPGVLDDLYAAKAGTRTLGATLEDGRPVARAVGPDGPGGRPAAVDRRATADPQRVAATRQADGSWTRRRDEVVDGCRVPLGGHGLRADDRQGRGQPRHRPVLGGADHQLHALGAGRPRRPGVPARAVGDRRTSRWCGPWTRRSTSCTCATSRSTTRRSRPRSGAPTSRSRRTAPGARTCASSQKAGLTTVHLLPTFDIASIQEDRALQKTPDCDLASYAPGLRPAAGVRDRGGRRRRLQLGLRPVPLVGARGLVRGGRGRRRARRRVPHDGRRAALRRPAGGARPGVQPHHGERAAPQSVLDRVVPGYYQRLSTHRHGRDLDVLPERGDRARAWRRRPWSTRW